MGIHEDLIRVELWLFEGMKPTGRPAVDNYGTHKTPRVRRWLARHARFHLHFTPTSAS